MRADESQDVTLLLSLQPPLHTPLAGSERRTKTCVCLLILLHHRYMQAKSVDMLMMPKPADGRSQSPRATCSLRTRTFGVAISTLILCDRYPTLQST